MDHTRRTFLGLATAVGGLTLAPAGAALAGLSHDTSPQAASPLSKAKVNRKTRYGINATDQAAVHARLADCGGHIGIARVFHNGMLPATWNWSVEGASPQSACHVSFKAEPSAVGKGLYDKRIVGWLNSIPAGWRVYLTFWHEPNDELRSGRFSAASYRAAWSRLSKLVRKHARLKKGVVVGLVPVFMAYNVGRKGYWSDSWVPRPKEVTFLSWDIYGNPRGGAGLAGAYVHPRKFIDPCLKTTQRLGFKQWGISEFNTPARSWDSNETGRRQWLTDFKKYARSRRRKVAPELGAPRTLLLWEGNGTNWNENFHKAATWKWWAGVAKA